MAGRAEICLREVNVTTGGRSSATSFHSPARGKPARKTQTSAFALVGDNESFRFFFSGNWSILVVFGFAILRVVKSVE